MSFFRTLKRSVYDREFYRAVPGQGFSSAVKYFAILTALLSLAVGIIFSSRVGWSLVYNSDVAMFRSQVEGLFPDELVLQFGNGGVSSNVDEPYAIPFPEAWKESADVQSERMPRNLLVINTGKPIEFADFSLYDTAAILSKDHIGFYDVSQEKFEIQNIGGLAKESLTLDKAQYMRLIDTGAYYLKVIIVVLLCFSPLFLFLFLFPVYIVYLLFGAVVVWLAAKARGVRLTYKQAYACGLYLVTLPVLYEILAALWAPALVFPFDATLILFVLALVNFAPLFPETSVIESEKTVVEDKDAPL